MRFSFAQLDYHGKSRLVEIGFLFFLGVLSPLAVGLQIFSKFSYVLSLVFVNILNLPAVIFFYRIYLPYTIGRGRYFLTILLLFPYLLLYELNSRLSTLITIAMPFIPQGYRNNLASGHPWDFTRGYFNQSIGYTCLVLLAVSSLYAVRLLLVSENEKLKLELNQLKTQLHPHFFFNTLNNLYVLAMEQSPAAPQMIADLSAIMRYILYETQQDLVPLEKEIGFLRSYIHLESLRHTEPDCISFLVQGSATGRMIEPLLLLPLVENTFKHALGQDMPEKWVKMVLSIDEHEIIFQATNPKPTGAEVESHNNSGIGLANVKKRIELLYPHRHELAVHDEEQLFTVTLMLR